MTDDQSTTSPKRYWRSLEELNNAADVQRRAMDEFVPAQLEEVDAVSRRSFMKVIGASAALAGASAMSGCKRKEDETIVPYVSQPPKVVPGKPLFFATAMTLGGYAQGIVARSREGRPVKLDGNPDHPASLGSSDVFMQAPLLGLYDPDRSLFAAYRTLFLQWRLVFEIGAANRRNGRAASSTARLLHLVREHLRGSNAFAVSD